MFIYLFVGIITVTRNAKRITAISALQERNITARLYRLYRQETRAVWDISIVFTAKMSEQVEQLIYINTLNSIAR